MPSGTKTGDFVSWNQISRLRGYRQGPKSVCCGGTLAFPFSNVEMGTKILGGIYLKNTKTLTGFILLLDIEMGQSIGINGRTIKGKKVIILCQN